MYFKRGCSHFIICWIELASKILSFPPKTHNFLSNRKSVDRRALGIVAASNKLKYYCIAHPWQRFWIVSYQAEESSILNPSTAQKVVNWISRSWSLCHSPISNEAITSFRYINHSGNSSHQTCRNIDWWSCPCPLVFPSSNEFFYQTRRVSLPSTNRA